MNTLPTATMKQTPQESVVPASTASPAEENGPTVATLQVDTATAISVTVPVAEDDSPTPKATSFAAEPMPSSEGKRDLDEEPTNQPPSYEQSISQRSCAPSSTSTKEPESARQAALRRGAPANASATCSEDSSSNGIADLLSRFAAMLFPKYAPAPAQVVVLGDDEAPVDFLVRELLQPLLGPEVTLSTVAMVRGLSYLTAKAETHHIVAFPKVVGFMHKKVEHALESANQIYFLLDSQRPTSTPLPPYLHPHLKHVTFLCIHSLARPEKISPKFCTLLELPADKSVTILDGSSPTELQVQFTNLWRAAADIAREKRLDKLLESQQKARALASGGVEKKEE